MWKLDETETTSDNNSSGPPSSVKIKSSITVESPTFSLDRAQYDHDKHDVGMGAA